MVGAADLHVLHALALSYERVGELGHRRVRNQWIARTASVRTCSTVFPFGMEAGVNSNTPGVVPNPPDPTLFVIRAAAAER
jgi:hypothetical protein